MIKRIVAWRCSLQVLWVFCCLSLPVVLPGWGGNGEAVVVNDRVDLARQEAREDALRQALCRPVRVYGINLA